MLHSNTICAIATAHGGAIGIIRVSGTDALAYTDRIFTPTRKSRSLSTQAGYTLSHGQIKDEKGNIIDEVLVAVYHGPHSYTGEDSTEIMCHDSAYILHTIIQLLLKQGCRMAAPGEFTQRAFLNGKMDLSQAEAVADVIASSSESAHRLAMSQMRGGFSRDLKELRDQLLNLTSLMELELDFSDHEELEFADRGELNELTEKIERKISRLTDSFRLGNAIKQGIPVAIIGETNAGKSTLLNALLNEEKAIVSNIHGTTRDVIEDTIQIKGISFRFIDTAGIRQTADTIENLGIERTFSAIEKAQIVILTYDLQQNEQQLLQFIQEIKKHLYGKKIILAGNKSDLSSTTPFLPSSIQQELDSITNQENDALPTSSAESTDPSIQYLQTEALLSTTPSAIPSSISSTTPSTIPEAISVSIPSSSESISSTTPAPIPESIPVAIPSSSESISSTTPAPIPVTIQTSSESIPSATPAPIPVAIQTSSESIPSAVSKEQASNTTLNSSHWHFLPISARNKHNIDQLEQLLIETAALPEINTHDVIVTNARHYEALNLAHSSILRVQEGLSSQLPGDLISQDLRECIYHLSDIAGEVTTDQVLSHIFQHFCIGK